MARVVYTRARARLTRFIQIKATTTTYTLIYLHYTLHLLGFGGVILVHTRDTPRHAKIQIEKGGQLSMISQLPGENHGP